MNSSASWFTSYERSLLKNDYGTQRHRLSRDHLKPLDFCTLCLQRSRDPVCCSSHGDIFCRECAIQNLLSQRKEIKRLQREVEKRHAEEEEERLRLEKEAVERGIKEFEQVQSGLERRQLNNKKRKANEDIADDESASTSQRIIGRENGKVIVEESTTPSEPTSTKRTKTFTLDEAELRNIALADRERLKESINQEKSQSLVPKLPSFWIPSLTPSLSSKEQVDLKPPKLQPICPGSDPERLHYFNLKNLITINFAEEKEEKNKHGDATRVCPNCRKALTNETKAIATKTCGHVLCKTCVNKFILTNHNLDSSTNSKYICPVCDNDITENLTINTKRSKDSTEKMRPGLVQISSDGTGFTAGGGKVLAKKETVAFQC